MPKKQATLNLKRYKMPIMPRTNKKATRIAYSILGVPANMKKATRKKYKEPRDTGRQYDELLRIVPDTVSR